MTAGAGVADSSLATASWAGTLRPHADTAGRADTRWPHAATDLET
jgi:hypothetical protein